MIQNCQVYINIECWEEDKPAIMEHLRGFFKDKKNWRVYGQPVTSVDITDDAEGFIVVDIEVDAQCMYIGGSRGDRWNPGEPPYIDSYLDEQDFADWAEDLIPKIFDVSIEIDEGSSIPTEEELIKEFEEEAEREHWYSRYEKY